METHLQIDDTLLQQASAEAARRGVTVDEVVRSALERELHSSNGAAKPAADRRQRFDELLIASAQFRVGPHPTRDEMNER